jgi:heat shock protein HslJ
MRFRPPTVAVAMALALAALLGACSTPASKPALPPVTPIMVPPPMSAQQELVGGVWHWQGGNAGAAPARELYTVEFTADGRVLVRADCNRGSGRYSTGADATVTLTAIATTKMGCPAGSLDTTFLRELADVERYRFEGDMLVLTLRSNAATLRFSR